MRKVVAAINMTIDGYCDHTYGVPDEEIHQHYTDLLQGAGVALYGRVTFQLMEYWRTVLDSPTGKKPMDDFAQAIDRLPKIVFSKTLKKVDWASARLASRDLKDEVMTLSSEPGKDILICSPSLIVALTKLDLIDEYQLCVHPVIAGQGLALFEGISKPKTLKFVNSKSFNGGAVILYYHRGN